MIARVTAKLNERQRLTVVIAVLISAVAGVTIIDEWLFYRQAIKDERAWLLNVVKTQARLMDAVARFDIEHSGKSDPVMAASMTMSQIIDAKLDEGGFGETGEFVLGRRAEGMIEFLLPQRLNAGRIPAPVPFTSELSEPMRLALAGEVGTIIARDYRDAEVVAAFAPIAALNLGLVAKIDHWEIQGHLLNAAILGGLVMMGIVVIAVFATHRLTSPIITDLESKTEQLEKLNQDLTRSNEDLEQFAYVASHDLKAPLRGIENLVDWLAEDLEGKLDDAGERYVTLLKGRTARMEALLSGLLEYSRIGRKNVEIERVDTWAVVRSAIELMSPPEGMKINVAPDLPTISAPKVPIDLVFRNLIGNAIKHHDRGEGSITVESVDRNGFHEFAVRDDGPGIEPQFHERIFGFFKTLKPRDEVEGSGMGLTLVKRTVEFYSGQVWVESDPSQARGTAIRFTWPKMEA